MVTLCRGGLPGLGSKTKANSVQRDASTKQGESLVLLYAASCGLSHPA